MAPRSEKFAAAQAVLAPLRWAERARGRRRLALLAAYTLVLFVGIAAVWRIVGIRSLPDVGDPFDVAEYRPGPVVASAEDATPLYEQAVAKLVPYRGRDSQGIVAWRGRRLFQET